MKDSAIVKIVAIASLTILEVANLLTAKVDGALLFSIGAIIGGIAGYELKGTFEKMGEGEGGEG